MYIYTVNIMQMQEQYGKVVAWLCHEQNESRNINSNETNINMKELTLNLMFFNTNLTTK